MQTAWITAGASFGTGVGTIQTTGQHGLRHPNTMSSHMRPSAPSAAGVSSTPETTLSARPARRPV